MLLQAEIAGGGLGAMATAIALAKRGWKVRVHERQPALQSVGAGIYIWENGLRVLEALDAFDDATRAAHRGSVFETRDRENRIVEQIEFPEDSRVFSVPREQLLTALERSARRHGVEIVTNSEVVGASPEGQLSFVNEETVTADLVIGVDGVNSRVRHALYLSQVHDRTDEGAIRLMIPSTDEDYHGPDGHKYIENWNGTRRLLITPVNAKEIYLALTCMNDDVDAKQLPVNKPLWKDTFPTWSHYIDRIGTQGHWDTYSVIKTTAWSNGRAAILGDAAHAQTPNLGQGGSMAMQNGLALAVALENTEKRDDIPQALETWEKTERPLIDHTQKWASLYGEVAHLPDDLRTRVFRGIADAPWLSAQLFRAAGSVPTGT